MSAQQPDRQDLIRSAQDALMHVTSQLDILFDLVSLYVDRYPCITAGDIIRTKELNTTIRELGMLPGKLAAEIARWQHGMAPLLSPEGLREYVLNELLANVGALDYFLTSYDLDMVKFDKHRFADTLSTIETVSRQLSQPAKT